MRFVLEDLRVGLDDHLVALGDVDLVDARPLVIGDLEAVAVDRVHAPAVRGLPGLGVSTAPLEECVVVTLKCNSTSGSVSAATAPARPTGPLEPDGTSATAAVAATAVTPATASGRA